MKSNKNIEWLNPNSVINDAPLHPSVSIVLATYNGENYVEELLESLRSQLHAPFEVIVGDDGSTDRTIELVRKFARECNFLVGLRRTKNLGSSENFLSTARFSSGDWVIFCDQDDVWCDNRISLAIKEINTHPNLVAILQSCALCDADLEPRSKSLFPLTHSPGTYAPNSLNLPHVWPGFLQVLRRDLIDIAVSSARPKQNHHHENDALIAHDRWTFILASMIGDVLIQDISVAKFRRHADAQTGFYNGEKNRIRQIRKIAHIRYDRNLRTYSHFLTLQAFLKRSNFLILHVDSKRINASSNLYFQRALEAKSPI